LPSCHKQTLRRALIAALLCGAAPAWAQDVPSGNAAPPAPQVRPPAPGQLPDAGEAGVREVYTPADFARFAPRTALDMIEQIPGFNVIGGGSGGFVPGGNERGFGEASENLLINGQRITSKSSSTRDQLARIPVGNVIRIDVVDGATLDLPGLSGRVANIIVRSGGISGQFDWHPQIATGPAPINWGEGTVSLTGSTAFMEYTVSLDANGFTRGSDGLTLFRDGAGVADERFNRQTSTLQRPEINGSFGFDLGPGITANLNVNGGLHRFSSREDEHRLASNPLPTLEERLRTKNHEDFYEISGDIEFPLGPGRLKLIALESFTHGDFRSESLLDIGGSPTTGTLYTRINDSGERIARGEYGWRMLGADMQLSGEAAFNRLDQVGRLFVYAPAAQDFAEVPFPSGVGGVREQRYEGILSIGFPLSSHLTAQMAAGAEQSTISQTGAGALSRSFQRPKGSLRLAWAPEEGLNVSLEVARRVGQLNFNDFLASVSLVDNNQSAGNNQLRPQQSWETTLEATKSLGPWGSVTLTLFDHRVEDFITYLPVTGGEARGNIDSARRYGLKLNASIELAQIGWRGARLVTNITAENSRLIDPVTGVSRRFDGNNPLEIRTELRHDVPATDWAWGGDFRYTQTDIAYRVTEFTLTHNPETFAALFLEHKDVLGLKMRVRAGNLLREGLVYERTLYGGPRDTAAIIQSEQRALDIGYVFQFAISGSF
jgi:TonB dependent receptor/TonB-dependent Receptor Plug Domain